MLLPDSFIECDGEGTAVAFVGADATQLYRAMTIRHALRLLAVGIKPTRGVSMTRALSMVAHYTGKTYKRTQHAQAIRDLSIWIDAMLSALPIKTNGRA
jgi:hypothetical protein